MYIYIYAWLIRNVAIPPSPEQTVRIVRVTLAIKHLNSLGLGHFLVKAMLG